MLLAMFVAFAADAWTVKFTNPNNWNSVYCHAWNGGTKLLGEWPGTLMTKDGDVWTITATTSPLPEKVMFNLGGDGGKTAEMDFVDGATYNASEIVDGGGVHVPNTVFFCNKPGWQEVYIHYYQGNATATSWPGVKMERTDQTYNGYPIYKYVFPNGLPAKVIFNQGNNQAQTNEAVYKDGALYISDGHNQEAKSITNPVDDKGVSLNQKEYTIYFFDKNGLDGVNVRIWDEGDNHDRVAAMINTGKYVYDGVNYWPAYSYTFTTANIPAYIRFKDITGDMRFVNGAFYTNTDFDRPSSVTYHLVDKRDEEKYVYIYVNMAEDWLTAADTSFKPHCHVFNNTISDAEKIPSDNANEEMTNVRYQIWEYRILREEFNRNNYNDAIFYVKLEDGSYGEYRASIHETKCDYEPENWAKYIYGLSKPGATRYTRQSYLTYPEFVKLDNAGRNTLYLIGASDDKDWSVANGWSWDFAKARTYKEDDGVFYIGVGGLKDNIAFKLSWLDFYNIATEKGYTEPNNDRLWATFDLGLIGVDDTSEVFETGELSKEYIHKWNTYGDCEGNTCHFPLRVSLPYNNYNQFNWQIDTSRTKPEEGKEYMVVVDTHPGCRTLTLISFDPNPSIVVEGGAIRTEDLNMTRAAQVHSADNHLHGAEVNGHQYLNRVNVSSGDVTIKPSAMPDEFRNEFDIEYTVLMNGDDAATVANAGTVHLDYLPSASSIKAGVRAMYTSKHTKLTFHSKTGEGEMKSDVTLPEPSVEFVDGIHRYDKQNVDGTYDMHAVVMAKYNGPETGYAYFADFDADANGVNTPVLCHSKMGWINDPREEALYYLGQGDNFTPWVPKTSGVDEFEAENCWASIIRDSNQLPFYLPAVQQVDDPKNVKLVEGNLTVYAVYPFLVRTKETVQTAAELAAARDGESGVPEDLSGFTLVNIRKSADTTFSIPGGRLTGVEEVATEDVEAEPEYYTISGVRVQGRLEPGIYICRKGNKVEKIYVR